MSVSQTEKEKHLQMVYKNNVVVAMDGAKIIVVHSKRSIRPLIPFEISKEVFDKWKQRDSRISVTNTPFRELFGSNFNGASSKLEYIVDFNMIEFSEE